MPEVTLEYLNKGQNGALLKQIETDTNKPNTLRIAKGDKYNKTSE